MYCLHEFSPHSHSTSYYSTMKIIGPSTSISRHVPSACTLNMNSRPLLCLLRIPLPVPLPQDCGDACAASGECALLRGSKLLVFAEADEPMERINLDDEVRGCVREGVALGLRHRGRRRRQMCTAVLPLPPQVICARGCVGTGALRAASSHTIRPDKTMRIRDVVGARVNFHYNGVGIVLHLYFQ